MSEMQAELKRIENRAERVMSQDCCEPYDEKTQCRKLLQVAGSKLIQLLQMPRPSVTADGRVVTAEFTRDEMERINEVIGNLDEITLKVGCLLPIIPAGLTSKTSFAVRSFAQTLAEKLFAKQEKYPNDNWAQSDWEEECQEMLIHHVDKGDPVDVAAICMFMQHHGWRTKNVDTPPYTPPPKPKKPVITTDADWLRSELQKITSIDNGVVSVTQGANNSGCIVRVVYLIEGKENYFLQFEIQGLSFYAPRPDAPGASLREVWLQDAKHMLAAEHVKSCLKTIKSGVLARLLSDKGGKVLNVSMVRGALTWVWKCRDGSRNVVIPFAIPRPYEVYSEDIGKAIYDEIMSQRGEYNTRRIRQMRKYFKGKSFIFLRGCPMARTENLNPMLYGGKIVQRIDRRCTHVVVPPPNHQMKTKSQQTMATEDKIKKAELLGLTVLTWKAYKKLCR